MQQRSRYASKGTAQSAMYKAASAAHEAGADRADQEDELAEDNEATWARREAARMRQIMIGKARPEYRRYIQEVALDQRDPAQPSTPNPKDRVSKRQFDRALGDWRRRLHEFDSEMGYSAAEGDSSPSVSPSAQTSASAQPMGLAAQSTSSSRRRNRGGSRGGMAIGEAADTPEQVPPPSAPALPLAASTPQVPPLPGTSPSQLEASWTQGNAVDTLGFESFPTVPPMPTQPPMDGIVQLRLADQLPEPACQSMSMPAQGCGCAVQEFEPCPDFLAAWAAAASLTAPWPLPCDEATAAMMAMQSMGHSAELAAAGFTAPGPAELAAAGFAAPGSAELAAAGFSTVAGSAEMAAAGFCAVPGSAEMAAMLGPTQPAAIHVHGQTQPADDPETPNKPRQMGAGFDDGETPPPNEMQAGRHFQAGALGMVTEEPLDKPTRLTYEEWPEVNAAADQCPTAIRRPTPPGRKVAAYPGSPVCRTPPRSRAGMLMRSPGSVVKTPTAGLLVPETPSPERFYPHHSHNVHNSQNLHHLLPPFAYPAW